MIFDFAASRSEAPGLLAGDNFLGGAPTDKRDACLCSLRLSLQGIESHSASASGAGSAHCRLKIG